MELRNTFKIASNLSEKMKELTKKTLEHSKKLEKNETNKKINCLFSTEAGQMAQEMDAMDGTTDGKISASVWNNYASGHEGRTTISENGSISVFDAIDSITTYMVREEAEANGKYNPNEKPDPNIDYD